MYDGILNENNEYIVSPRMKLGDGIHLVNELPFLVEKKIKDNTLII